MHVKAVTRKKTKAEDNEKPKILGGMKSTVYIKNDSYNEQYCTRKRPTKQESVNLCVRVVCVYIQLFHSFDASLYNEITKKNLKVSPPGFLDSSPPSMASPGIDRSILFCPSLIFFDDDWFFRFS